MMRRKTREAVILLLTAAAVAAAAWLGWGSLSWLESGGLAGVRSALEEIGTLESQQMELRLRINAIEGEILRFEFMESEFLRESAKMSDELSQVQTLAGLFALEGPGVRVTLADAAVGPGGASPAGKDKNNYIVHDRDVLRVINALRGAGAEAVGVNGVIVGMRDAVRCVGPVISVGGRRLAPPYLIEAIGDVAVMVESLPEGSMSGIRAELTAFGIVMEIEIADLIVLSGPEGE